MTTAAELHRPYGLRRRATYDELVQYIKRDNGEFLVPTPDRTSTIIEMMSPYLSAWKVSQQAMIAQKQAQLAYWSSNVNGSGQGDTALPPQNLPQEDWHSIPQSVEMMIDGRSRAVGQYRQQQADRLHMHLERASQNEHDRQRGYDEFFIGSDPGAELAQHEGVDLRPLEPPRTGPQPTAETLREAAVQGGRMGALSGVAAAGARGALAEGRWEALRGTLLRESSNLPLWEASWEKALRLQGLLAESWEQGRSLCWGPLRALSWQARLWAA